MKNGMDTTYDGSISYLYNFLFAGGCMSFQRVGCEFRVTRFSQFFALFARFCYLLSFFSGVFMKILDPAMSTAMLERLSPVLKVILAWECLTCAVTYAESCIMLDMHRKRHTQLVASMQQMDNDILRDFAHVRWNYEKTHRKYARTSVLLVALYFLFSKVFLFGVVNCACGFVSSLLITLPYTVITGSIGLVGFLHIALLDYLRLRFRLLQKLLAQLYEARVWSTKQDEAERHARIVALFGYAKRCTALTRELNKTFGFAVACGLFYDFAIMTNFTFVLCQKLIEAESTIYESAMIALLLFLHWYKVIMQCIYGYALQKEQRNCYHALKSYGEHFYASCQARDTVESFQHWKMHNNFRPTFGSFMPIDLSILYSVVNSVANYALILIQLLYQQINIKNALLEKDMLNDVEIISNYQINQAHIN